MPQAITLLSILGSCPSDLGAELTVLQSVVEELNPKLRDAYSVQLRLMTAVNSVVPGIGTDPQAVVSSQIGEQYDIYIGLLGTRFGTKTPRAGSGTEEEFREARDRWLNSPTSVRILFYFKAASDVSVQDLDLEQLSRVQKFKKSTAEKELLYAEFRTTNDFLRLVRDHLWDLVAKQWDGDKCKWRPLGAEEIELDRITLQELKTPGQAAASVGIELAKVSASISVLPEEANDDSMEVLDAIVEAEDSVQGGMVALDRIGEITRKQNERFVEGGKVIKFEAAQTPPNTKAFKSAVDAAADDLAAYARALRQEIPAFSSAFISGFNAFEAGMDAWIKTKPTTEQIIKVEETLDKVIPILDSSRDPVLGFRDVLARIPNLTSRFRTANRATLSQLDELVAALAVISDRAQSISARLKASHDSAN